jgi:cell division protein FtsW
MKLDKYFKGDKMIWLVVILLSLFSLLVVYSSTVSLAVRRGLTPLSYFTEHLGFLVGGFALLYIISRMPYTLFMGAAKAGFWGSMGLLALTLAIGSTHQGAARSLFGFQPVEIAKIALIIYVAKLLTVNQDVIVSRWKEGYIKVLWPVLAMCSFIFVSNFSTAAVLGATCFTMMFIGRTRFKHLTVTILILLIAVALAAMGAKKVVDKADKVGREMGIERTKDIRKPVPGMLGMLDKVARKTRLLTIYGRVDAKINKDKPNANPQISDSQIAIASGGVLWGKGPGKSTMRLRLPEAYSDFAFAIVVEEYGVLFACIIMLCYLIVLYRVGVMTRRATNFFPTLLAIGIGTQIMLQALVNMCVSAGLVPVTGQNLPFISRGGSSIIGTCIMFGILLSVSRSQTETEEKEQQRKAIQAENEVQPQLT